MPNITSKSRTQIEFKSLEDFIEKENIVRFIDAFVEKIELEKLFFVSKPLRTEGRPSFTNQLFLKIYFYGYLNGLRSSRKLAKECIRNIEMQWLCNGTDLLQTIIAYQILEKLTQQHCVTLLNYLLVF